jgi:F0F1-type ATP synthase assembly protein I
MAEKQKKDKGVSINKAMLAVGDGVIGAAVLIIIGIYLGLYLDKKFMTSPWFTLGLLFLGGGIGLARLVMKAMNLDKLDEDETQ